MVGEKNRAIKVAPSLAKREPKRLAPVGGPVLAPPRTVIVRDSRENPKKCSILPLRGRPDLEFLTYPANFPPPSLNQRGILNTNPESRLPDLNAYVCLAAEGPELSPKDAGSGLLLLDGSWRRAEGMIRAFQHVPPPSLKGYHTAYPRVSKKGTDPANDLATVEALFLAYRILGRPTAGLLDHYRWAEEFLRLNGLVTEKA